MTLLRLFGFASIFEYWVRKINIAFLMEQNVLLLYEIMSFGNFFLLKTYAWIKYIFLYEK